MLNCFWNNITYICIFNKQKDDAGGWNTSAWKIRTYLSYRVNIMAADDLVMQGARASAGMVLTSFSWNILVSVTSGLKQYYLQVNRHNNLEEDLEHKSLFSTARYRLSYIDGLVQDCNISIANALEMLQSCTKPSTYNKEKSPYHLHSDLSSPEMRHFSLVWQTHRHRAPRQHCFHSPRYPSWVVVWNDDD